MQSNSEGRIIRLETLMKWVQDRLRSITTRLDSLDNQVRQASGIQYGWGGTGSGGTEIYWAQAPGTGSWAATGTFPSITPDSFTVDVYTMDGSPTLEEADATIYYHSTATLAASSIVVAKKNDDGTYSIINVMCMGGG